MKGFIHERAHHQQCSNTTVDQEDTTGNSVILVTHDSDADFRLVKEKVSCTQVPLTDQHNVLSNER